MIINCTPHPIIINNETFPTSGIIPRVETIEVESTPIEGFSCATRSMGEVQGLPEQVEGTFLIVSAMVLSASDRKDLIAPDTGSTAVRDTTGRIIQVTRFIKN